VYDAVSARAVAALSGTQALATASFAVAAATGASDNDMTLETNMAALRAHRWRELNSPPSLLRFCRLLKALYTGF
jgi:hypothetical protein